MNSISMKKSTRIKLLYLTIFSMLFLPDTTYGFRIDDVLLFILLLITAIKKGGSIKLNTFPILLVTIYILILTFSVFYNLNFFDVGKTNFGYMLNDSIGLYMKEIFRALKTLIIVIICCNLNLDNFRIEKFLKYFLNLCYILALVGIAQYFNLFGINQFISANYNEGGRHNALISEDYFELGMLRISTFFYTPNIYAAFLLIPLSLSFKKVMLDRKFAHWFGIGIITINLVFTQSRTALVIAILIFFLYLWYVTFVLKKISLFNFVVYTILPFIGYYFINMVNLNIVQRFVDILKFGVVTSSGRGSVIDQAKEILITSPLFGYSPIVTNNIASDNELKIFIHYGGLLGVIFYFILIYILYKKVRISNLTRHYKFYLLTLIVCLIVVGTTNGFIISNRIFPIFIVIFTILTYSNWDTDSKLNNT